MPHPSALVKPGRLLRASLQRNAARARAHPQVSAREDDGSRVLRETLPDPRPCLGDGKGSPEPGATSASPGAAAVSLAVIKVRADFERDAAAWGVSPLPAPPAAPRPEEAGGSEAHVVSQLQGPPKSRRALLRHWERLWCLWWVPCPLLPSCKSALRFSTFYSRSTAPGSAGRDCPAGDGPRCLCSRGATA